MNNFKFIKDNFLYRKQKMNLNIVYEDKDIIVINKSNNMVVHPGAGNIDNTIFNALLYHYPEIINVFRAGIVHRLDKNTTGLMIIAKNELARTNLIKMLKKRKIIREYEAVVVGRIIAGNTINASITRDRTKRTRMIVNNSLGKLAITHYRVIERFQNHTHIRIKLETGRTHQIRVHMLYIKHPIVGDLTYGGYRKYPKNSSKDLNNFLNFFNRQALHAIQLKIIHPINFKQMEWNIPLPSDILNLIDMLKKY